MYRGYLPDQRPPLLLEVGSRCGRGGGGGGGRRRRGHGSLACWLQSFGSGVSGWSDSLHWLGRSAGGRSVSSSLEVWGFVLVSTVSRCRRDAFAGQERCGLAQVVAFVSFCGGDAFSGVWPGGCLWVCQGCKLGLGRRGPVPQCRSRLLLSGWPLVVSPSVPGWVSGCN